MAAPEDLKRSFPCSSAQLHVSPCHSSRYKINDWCTATTFHCDWIICLFGLRFNVPVNSYGHAETVNSHNHPFPFGKYFVHILSLLNDNPSWNDARNYFMFNLHESMGLGHAGTNSRCLDVQSDLLPSVLQ